VGDLLVEGVVWGVGIWGDVGFMGVGRWGWLGRKVGIGEGCDGGYCGGGEEWVGCWWVWG